MKKLFTALGFAIGLAAGGANAADDYPTKPITWVVPFTAGGVTV